MKTENENMQSSRNGGTVLAVVLMSIGLWIFGSVIAAGFIIIVLNYHTAIKNEISLMSIGWIGWTMYCFCNGYLKYRYVVVQSFLPLIDAKLLKLKQQLDEYFSE